MPTKRKVCETEQATKNHKRKRATNEQWRKTEENVYSVEFHLMHACFISLLAQ